MCGIAGFYSTKNSFSSDELRTMTGILNHRGPDAEGYYEDGIVALGHKRLRIIDLSDSANQPMFSRSGRYAIVYNGEVYNFKEIAEELIEDNPLKTKSDTEVILEAFEKWGTGFVERLNGMFAFAIYDLEKKVMHLYRDRMGIKPLFYYWDGQDFAFASEIKSLLQLRMISKGKSLNKVSISSFLYLGYIPEPDTVYKNIYKFPSGSYLKLDANGLNVSSYWNLEEQLTAKTFDDTREAFSQFKELLNSSVNYRMYSDVPLGTFLSGGIDSSLITAVAQKLSNKPVKTFTIGFKETKYNESFYARAVADHLGTEHHEYVVSQKDALDLIPDMLDAYDEPYADSSAIPTMLVSKLAREHVTVTLSGDGGDELFMGYGSYQWGRRFTSRLVRAFRMPMAVFLSMRNSRSKRAAHMLRYKSFSRLKSHIFSQEQYLFTELELNSLVTPEYYRELEFEENYYNVARSLSFTEQQSIFDIQYYLKDDLLTKVDRASMKYSLENRVPLLDHRIVEFAINLSSKIKMPGNHLKVFLKKALYEYVPQKFFNRPKQGFSIPLGSWMKNELNFLIEENLSDKVIGKFEIIDAGKVRDLKRRFSKGEDYLYNRLWSLIVLHKFMNKNF
ncbi:MAG: asparagine synthase (glutamine-hydrolyzing) [Bacteroidetes bacterium]|nr:asparagine synthase (glutamine-hydrolyzing) [Bacteroidota bacterium]